VTPGPQQLLVGVLVGGQGSRMGGLPKGNLSLEPGGEATLLSRSLDQVRQALGASCPVVLVGDARAYLRYGLPNLPDEPLGQGPLGGLRTLLRAARERGTQAIALAVDMPHFESALVERLAVEAPEAAALLPRPAGLWQPLFARYDPLRVGPALECTWRQGQRSLQAVVGRLGAQAVELPLDAAETNSLRDWDTPQDRQDSWRRSGAIR